METRSNDAAFRGESKEIINGVMHINYSKGLTKREFFAAMALQGLLANPNTDPERCLTGSAIAAVGIADEFIIRLNIERKGNDQ